MRCFVGPTAKKSAMFLRLNLCFTNNSCFRGIEATAVIVSACGWTDFLVHSPKPSLLQACTHNSMAHTTCCFLLFSCFCCLFCLNVCWLAKLCSYQHIAPSRKNIYCCLSSLPDSLFALFLFSDVCFLSSCCIHLADPSRCSRSFCFPTPHQVSWWQRLLTSASVSGRGSCFFGYAICWFSCIVFDGVFHFGKWAKTESFCKVVHSFHFVPCPSPACDFSDHNYQRPLWCVAL